MRQSPDRKITAAEDAHPHSGWWLPLAVLVTLIVLGAGFLLYDLRPAPGPRAHQRSSDTTPIGLTVGSLALRVPAHYIESTGALEGGAVDTLTLAMLLPDLRGYAPERADLFRSNAPDAPVLRLSFKTSRNEMDAATRLERLYGPHLDGAGQNGPFGLTRHRFRDGSFYARHELFTGQRDGKPVLLLCERESPDVASPNCLGTGTRLARDVNFTYRFKRSYLARWDAIARDVDRLLAGFRTGAP